jgi:hypothetical protein
MATRPDVPETADPQRQPLSSDGANGPKRIRRIFNAEVPSKEDFARWQTEHAQEIKAADPQPPKEKNPGDAAIKMAMSSDWGTMKEFRASVEANARPRGIPTATVTDIPDDD